jgi:hypothetical protein
MKLRKFTDDETINVLKDFNRYWVLCGTITNCAATKMEEAHRDHVRDFRWSLLRPFDIRIKDYDRMVHKICGGQWRELDDEFLKRKTGLDKYLSAWFPDADFDYAFTQKHFQDLVWAACWVGTQNHEKFIDFQILLEEYAENPVEFSPEDIKLIRNLRERLDYLENEWDKFNDAIQSN